MGETHHLVLAEDWTPSQGGQLITTPPHHGLQGVPTLPSDGKVCEMGDLAGGGGDLGVPEANRSSSGSSSPLDPGTSGTMSQCGFHGTLTAQEAEDFRDGEETRSQIGLEMLG